jgi:site-specific DNA-methyltransferase (adenine-specific)
MGMLKASERGIPRVHSNQKPIAVMQWCIEFTKGKTIFDPYMGSGTTGVAAVSLGRRFIGCEIKPDHFATSIDRIQAALAARSELLIAS